VTSRLKAGMVESEKMVIARQWLVETSSRGIELSWQRIWDTHIYGNDFLKRQKTVLKPLKAVISIRFSRSYERKCDSESE
jgi:hypothetical protein